MDRPWPHRPRLSRETRLLLITVVVAVSALWVLARIRFPDRPTAPNPVQPLLTQLAAPATFDDLAAEVSQAQPRLLPLMTMFELTSLPGAPVAGGARLRPALRAGGDVAVVLLDEL